MSKAHACDTCGKLITDSDIRITLDGYKVIQNEEQKQIPMGYGIGMPGDFCSFTCLSEWATKQQGILDEYKELAKKYEQTARDADDEAR